MSTWLPSSAFEMLVIGCLQEVSFTRPGMRKLARDLKDSAPGLFPKVGTSGSGRARIADFCHRLLREQIEYVRSVTAPHMLLVPEPRLTDFS